MRSTSCTDFFKNVTNKSTVTETEVAERPCLKDILEIHLTVLSDISDMYEQENM